ncbi:MAG: Spy/CpxP family protein refolding chaperone [Gemmatimonadetes bacterium]|nr:Spy/CpxP family protein refolding chaperone [Gemmatimonadota bacterium]MBI2537249.1 Spy/CpxP family protein refolding chaperone [Gemmatimonadota bacterium]MBI2616461.1 Spy/CpxP family protein refolding chaperone [Gemmatimonadota bacterium]
MTRKWTMSLALALLAGPVMAQQAQPPAQQPQPWRLGMGPGALGVLGPGRQVGVYVPQHLVNRREALGLTPEQVARLEALAQEAKQASDKAEAEAKTHWDQLAELWKQATPDVNQVRTHAQAAMQAMQGARVAHLVAAAQAKAVLTAEQRGRVAGWADAGRMRMQQRMDRPGRMGRMPMRMRRWPVPPLQR